MKNTELKSEIIKRLFPEELPEIAEIEKKYPPRNLKEGLMVTRIAPSPTGFMHVGSLYTALISERLAHQGEGVFFLRIEDTDKKREVEGAADLIMKSLEYYGIRVDEGQIINNAEVGNYGPYKQSERAQIYKSYVKYLIEKDLAYPCFCTHAELEEMRSMQEAQSVRPGYYKQWAKWRDKSEQEILRALEEKKEFVIRYKSNGDFNKRIIINDALKGSRELPENDQDIVIMKSEGLPTYHMAHIIDDHLMGTTHVLRGDEWFSSTPLHLQLFEAMNWNPPIYGHLSPIQKIDGSSKRKLSKRKDPEANVAYYEEQGYPQDAVIEYLLNLANSNFEDWRKANPGIKNNEFKLTLNKLSSSSGALFDCTKLNSTSREMIATYSASEIFERVLDWSEKYDLKLFEIMRSNSEYVKSILDIERGGQIKVRKDISKWSEIRVEIEYFFDDFFNITKSDALSLISAPNANIVENIVKEFIESYDEKDSREEWFEKIKKISRDNNYSDNAKEFKNNPEKFNGNVADVAKIFRVLLTGRVQTPDLHSIMRVMGKERVIRRLSVV
jgi:glutamyl-tRNA synthetase